MTTEYWITNLHPPGAPQIPVGVLALPFRFEYRRGLTFLLRPDRDQVASGDDLLALREFPLMFADEVGPNSWRKARASALGRDAFARRTNRRPL